MAHSLPFLKRAIVQARFAWLTVPPRIDAPAGVPTPSRESARGPSPSCRPIRRRGGRTSHPSLDRMPLRYP